MREIKFRYRIRNKDTGGVRTVLLELRQLENSGLTTNHREVIDTIDEFTGLKDKNSKEIYEGDIVGSGLYYPSKVSFEDGCFTLEHPNQHGDMAKWKVSHFELEVLGNIYENPELLNAKI